MAYTWLVFQPKLLAQAKPAIEQSALFFLVDQPGTGGRMGTRTKQIIQSEESELLRLRRRHMNVTLAELSDRTGISKSYLHQLEIGRANVSNDKLALILKALNYCPEGVEATLNKLTEGEKLRLKCIALIKGAPLALVKKVEAILSNGEI